jgi:hypothetical protein
MLLQNTLIFLRKNKLKNTVIMQSCSKFSDICMSTIKSVQKYNFINNIILATDDKKIKGTNIVNLKVILMEKDMGFSSNMLEAISSCDEKYALVILDDYILPDPVEQKVNQQKLYEDACDLMNNLEDVACVRLNIFDKSCADFSNSYNGFVKVKTEFKYICSLQPAVWRLNSLKKILKKGENAWEAELNGSKRMRKANMHAYVSTFEAMIHINAMRHGKYVRDKFVDYADKNNILVPSNMDVFVKTKSKDGKTSNKSVVNLSRYRSKKESQ